MSAFLRRGSIPCLACLGVLTAVMLLSAACSGRGPTPLGERLKPTGETASASSLAPLYELNEGSSTDFRSAFDEGEDHTRFIVALSPT